MKTDGHDFLEQLEAFPPASFEGKFLKTSTRLKLGNYLSAEELSRLYRAAFRSALCNIAFNGLGGCDSEIKPDQEPNRRRLETEFMIARDRFFESPGWSSLPKSQKGSIERSFLTVVVSEENLAQ
jgi:hypothetical protein